MELLLNGESGDKKIDVDSPVSMNMWGLRPDFFTILENGFVEFLEKYGCNRFEI